MEKDFGILLEYVFGWLKHLDHQVPVSVGRRTRMADLVLCHPAGTLVIRIARPGVQRTQEDVNQLQLCMKGLKSEYGFIANDSAVWLYFMAPDSAAADEFASIPYKPGARDGAAFAELLNYQRFSRDKLDAFRLEKKKADTLQQAKRLMNTLCSGTSGKALLIKALAACPEVKAVCNARAVELAVAGLTLTKTAAEQGQSVPENSRADLSGGFTGFERKGIPVGSTIVFKGDPQYTATVKSDWTVMFEGEEYRLTPLARLLYGRTGNGKAENVHSGSKNFLFNGKVLHFLPDVEQ